MIRTSLFSMLAIFILTVAPTSKGYAAASIGRIMHTYGSAWVQRGSTREEAEKGQVVLRNDSIVTGSRGRVKIVMGDGSKVYIGANSRVSLRKYSLRGSNLLSASIHMLWGKARFFVNKLTLRNSSFRVRTSTAVLGVRGTEFVVIVPPTPELLNNAFGDFTLEDIPALATRTVLTEGAVDISVGGAAPERLLPGHTALVDKDGKVSIRETGEGDADLKGDNGKPVGIGERKVKGHGLPKPPIVGDQSRLKGKKAVFKKKLGQANAGLNDIPQDAVNALQNLNNTTEIIINPSFVAP
jgi:hypothetical protein